MHTDVVMPTARAQRRRKIQVSDSVEECMRLYQRDLSRLPRFDLGDGANMVVVKMQFFEPHTTCYRLGAAAGNAELAARFGGHGQTRLTTFGPHEGAKVFRMTKTYAFPTSKDAAKFKAAVAKNKPKGKFKATFSTSRVPT